MELDLMFARGREAADGGNYDYAIAIFQDVLSQDPDHLKSRIAMRGCELEKFRERGGGIGAKISGFFRGIGPYFASLISRSPEKVIPACEKFLANYPVHKGVLMRLAKALRARGHLGAAVNTLEFARQQYPSSLAVLVLQAEAYVEKGDYPHAVRCYEELRRLRPKDRLFSEKHKNLSAMGHMQKSGLSEEQSAMDSIRDKKQAAELEQEDRLLHSADEVRSAIARMQERFKKEPENPNILVRLGDLYVRQEHFDFARQAYEKAHEMKPSPVTEEKLEDLGLRVLQAAEEQAREALQADSKNAQLKTAWLQARAKRLEAAIKVFEERVRKHPTEIPPRHQLGRLHFERGGEEDLRLAIQCFQKTVSDPRYRESARLLLGRCFAQDPRTRDMAIRQFKQALESVSSPTGERAREIMYSLGELLEKMGDREEALSWYKKLFEIDAAYRQVSRKLEELS